MTNKTVFSKEEVQRIKKQWQDDDGAASVTDLIQMAGQALLHSPEIQQLRKDAERYRWLRDSCGIVEYKKAFGGIGSGMLPSGDALDSSIDAAMEVKP